MNILVVGGGSWDDTNSMGNTFSNLFSGWKNVTFYNFYSRELMPNNSVCKNYYRATTKELLKKFFAPKTIGGAFQTDGKALIREDTQGAKESRAISIIHRYGLDSVYELEDRLWHRKKWINGNLDAFIDQAKPDVIFAFAVGTCYEVLPIEYIKEKTGAKLILLVADDMHTTYRLRNNRHYLRLRKQLDRMMAMADRVYGISEEVCAHYNRIYGVNATTLYKGCTFENQPMKKTHQPLKLVYAGNLLFGRMDTLVSLAKCLEELNRDRVCATLDIYSGTIITDDQCRELNRGESSRFCGGISYDQVKEKLAEADIVLHVESFEEECIHRVQYSFSTKIIDCLQSGSVLMAIGPKGISSIEYPRRIPGAVVIDDLQDMKTVLKELLAEEDKLIKRAKEIREFALEHHDIEGVRNRLQKEFRETVE